MTKRVTYREPVMIYFQAGNRDRLHAAASAVGLSASAFSRVAVMERVKEVEEQAQRDRKEEPISV